MIQPPMKLRAAVVGLGMGAHHAAAYACLPEFELAALCDLSWPLLRRCAEDFGGAELFDHYETMLERVRPDVVCVATPTGLHEDMVLRAAEAGVRGIYCEKPIALSLRAARHMQQACEDRGIPLIVGHQRRLSAPYLRLRQAIQSGEIGEVYLMHGACPGDFLSDGTHLVDSLLYLNGDCPIRWVLAQIYRGRQATAEELRANPWLYHGTRYGHNVEEGAMAVLELANGVRVELQTGTLWQPAQGYQNIEVFGTKGRLLRAGDGAQPALSIQTGGIWRELPLEEPEDDGLEQAHRLLARAVLAGEPHPMGIANAIRGFEVVMAVYESARVSGRVELPLAQQEFPLDLMLAQSQIQ